MKRAHSYFCPQCGNVIAAALVEREVKGTEGVAVVVPHIVCCDREMQVVWRERTNRGSQPAPTATA